MMGGMRKALLVALLGLTACSPKSVEVSTAPTSDPTASADCQAGYEARRQELVSEIEAFRTRLNGASVSYSDPDRVRQELVIDFDRVRSKITESLDTLALECGASGDCASQISAWVNYEKAWLRELALVLSNSTKGSVPEGEPPVSCS